MVSSDPSTVSTTQSFYEGAICEEYESC